MADSLDEAITDLPTTSDSEQWSLFETLSPLAERIIQDSVSVDDVLRYLHTFCIILYVCKCSHLKMATYIFILFFFKDSPRVYMYSSTYL